MSEAKGWHEVHLQISKMTKKAKENEKGTSRLFTEKGTQWFFQGKMQSCIF